MPETTANTTTLFSNNVDNFFCTLSPKIPEPPEKCPSLLSSLLFLFFAGWLGARRFGEIGLLFREDHLHIAH